MRDFEIVDVSPEEIRPLFRALTECGRRYCHIRNSRVLAQTIGRLSEPPASLHIPTSGRTELANSALKALVPFDGDMAARMLRLDDREPDPDATWRALSRSERKRAKRMWTWAMDAGFGATPQGRPPKIDAALVAYCSRVVAEGCGQSRFQFSRPPDGGTPRGPMWRALMAALPLAGAFLGRVDSAPVSQLWNYGNRAEAVADILLVGRSNEFQMSCRQLGIGETANDVAEHPAKFRLAIARARARRNRARRK